MCDLIWSDPLEESTASSCKTPEDMLEWYDVDFVDNPARGVGKVFGYKATDYFLSDNGTLLSLSGQLIILGFTAIIRAHEVAREGYTENWYAMQKSS